MAKHAISTPNKVVKKHTEKKKVIKKKRGKFRAVRQLETDLKSASANSMDTAEFDWKELVIVGEKPENVRTLKAQGHWNFSHVEDTIKDISEEHPGCDIFLAGGSPEPYSSSIPSVYPNILAIVVKSGYSPPEFVSVQDFQHGKDEIRPTRSFNFNWAPMELADPPSDSKVFMLKNRERRKASRNVSKKSDNELEYLALFTMKPSEEWVRNENGDLAISHTQFVYPVDGENVDEDFDKENGDRLRTFIPDFCKRFDLDQKEHYQRVEQAIRKGFHNARQKVESRIKLLKEYPEDVLDKIKVVKILPRNDFIKKRDKMYVNKY